MILGITLIISLQISIPNFKKGLINNKITGLQTKKVCFENILSSLIIVTVLTGTIHDENLKVISAVVIALLAWIVCTIIGSIKAIDAEKIDENKIQSNKKIINAHYGHTRTMLKVMRERSLTMIKHKKIVTVFALLASAAVAILPPYLYVDFNNLIFDWDTLPILIGWIPFTLSALIFVNYIVFKKVISKEDHSLFNKISIALNQIQSSFVIVSLITSIIIFAAGIGHKNDFYDHLTLPLLLTYVSFISVLSVKGAIDMNNK